MKKLRTLLVFSGFICCLTACKKDDKPKIPSALIGTWYIRSYTVTSSVNGVVSAPYITQFPDTAKSVYYQFKSDGTGAYQANIDPAFILIPPTQFTYKVSGDNIVFSNNSNFLSTSACTYTTPSNSSLTITSVHNYTQGDDGISGNMTQTLNFSR